MYNYNSDESEKEHWVQFISTGYRAHYAPPVGWRVYSPLMCPSVCPSVTTDSVLDILSQNRKKIAVYSGPTEYTPTDMGGWVGGAFF